MDSTHSAETTPRTFEELTEAIVNLANRFALNAGMLLQEGKERNRQKYRRWVHDQTPFTVAEADRLRAIYLGRRELPPEIADQLPAPRMALTYAFAPTGENRAPSPTRDFTEADLLVAALVNLDREDLSGVGVDLLRQWLGDH